MTRFVIAGGSGSLGRAVADHRASVGDEVIILSRRAETQMSHRVAAWNGHDVDESWASLLDGAVLLNLAGELVDRRPTARNIELLTRSRTEPTGTLVQAARTHAPRRWLQMSTTAIYGDAGDDIITEEHPVAPGPPQMPGVAVPWEESADPAGAMTSLVVLRTGVVLQQDSPALDRMTAVTRWGLGGRMGSGRQWTTWLHIDDFLAAVDALADPHEATGELTGVVHVCSPEPCTNADLMAALRRACRRPGWAPPTPSWAIRLGAPLLGTDAALALTGRRCVPQRLLDAGFDFQHPHIADALDDLLQRPSVRSG